MGNIWGKMVGAATAGVLTLVAQAGAAQDKGGPFIARDADGNITTVDDAVGFGDQGQLALSTDAALELVRRHQSGESATELSVLPAADYFVIENLSVGGVVGVRYIKAGPQKTTDFSLGPRVGYNFELSRRLSVWPKIGLLYSHGRVKQEVDVVGAGDDVVTTQTRKSNGVELNLFAPVMLHPAPHFFAGFGPFLETQLNGDNRVTSWGFRLTIGGWV